LCFGAAVCLLSPLLAALLCCRFGILRAAITDIPVETRPLSACADCAGVIF
jgi:hypothetical protein